MKKVVFLVAFLLFVNVLQAQIIRNFGIKLGFNSSNIDYTPNPEYLIPGMKLPYEFRRADFSVGMFIQSFDLKNLDVETELVYLKEGAEDEYKTSNAKNGSERITWDYEYDFVKLGVNLKPKIQLGEQELFVLVGPAVNFLVKNRSAISVYGMPKDVFWGYNVGAGIKLNSL